MIYTFTPNPSWDRTFLVDHVTLGAYNRGEVTQLDPAGKGINVSRNLRQYGEASVIVGFFGGETGGTIVRLLEDDGYVVEALEVQGETRSNITLLESTSGQYTKFNEYGPWVGENEAAALLDLVGERTNQKDIWVLSGSLPPGLPENYYAQIIGRIRERGGLAFLDASGAALRDGCQASPYLARINQREAETYLGEEINSESELLAAIEAFHSSGIQFVAISRGDLGALMGKGGVIFDARPPKVEVSNPVGAGDAMMAALVIGQERGWDLERMARWSVAAGTVSAMEAGTAVAGREKAQSLAEQVEVRRLTV